MIYVGQPPYLECSSRGDKRFSAFYARPKSLNGQSIEQGYQAMKVFVDGSTGHTWHYAKGKRAVNQEDCIAAYIQWWKDWVEDQNLLPVLKAASGLSDTFGNQLSVCQAEVLWNIRNER